MRGDTKVTYGRAFQDSLKYLKEKRQRRRKEEVPFLSPDERQDLLEGNHPDFRTAGKERLQVGPNKGEQVPKELGLCLQAYSLIEGMDLPLKNPDLVTDILVIGAGGAGAAASLTAEEEGCDVILATKLRLGDANTVMAEGGLAAATLPGDSPYLHFLDTYGGGHYANDPAIISTLVQEGPDVIRWLLDLGVMFDRQPDNSIKVNYAGGHSRKRLHSCKDLTGLELMRVLRDEILNRSIQVLEFSPAVELLLDEEGACAGAVLYDLENREYCVVQSRAVILATGGIGRLHIQNFPTTNHYGATADGVIMAYRAGASLLQMDSIQYHPTGVAWPEQLFGQLITEVMRGHGGQLVNAQGDRFVNELECRDTCTAAIIRECRDRKRGVVTPTGNEGVWLDTPIIPAVEKHFVGIRQRFLKYGIDISKEPILVFPTQHYQNGGISIDIHGATDVQSLYAAGEVTGGVQGINRLGGNSLLDLFVFGRRAARKAVGDVQESKSTSLRIDHILAYHRELQELGVERERVSPLLLPDYRRGDGG